MMTKSKKIVIIGGGISGLVSAFHAVSFGHKVEIYEKSSSVGGLLKVIPTNGDLIEAFYHHSFPSDINLMNLVEKLKIKAYLKKYRPLSGYFLDKPCNLSTPIDFIRFRGLSLFDRIKVGYFLSKVKRISNLGDFDDLTAVNWIREKIGDKSFNEFFLPLLQSKFGSSWNEISAAWLISRIQLRANTSLRGELLLYPTGGYSILLNSLKSYLEEKKCAIHINSQLKSIELSEKETSINSIEIVDSSSGEVKRIIADHYLITIPPNILKNLCPNTKLSKDLGAFPFQGAICVVLALSNSASEIYWLNIKPRKKFGAIIEHTNLTESENYGGDIIYFLASYPDLNSDIWKKKDIEIANLYLEDLFSLFPNLPNEKPKWFHVNRTKSAGPLYTRGYLSALKRFSSFRENFSIIGMFSQYPERTIDDSIKQASEWFYHILSS